MHVQVNGEPRDVPEGSTVSELVAELGLRPGGVVVEHNGEPLERKAYEATRLAEGDVVEIVRPVQGGASPVPAVREALDRARLYLVCDATFPLDVLDEVCTAGVGVVQLREKDAEAAEVLERAEGVKDVARRHGIPFIVNDRPDLALAAGADGVHLGQDDLPAPIAREILGPGAIIGRSTHDPDQIDRAVEDNRAGLADYIAVGPVHATPTKPGRPAVGHELVSYAAERVAFPWFAIGGIDPDNVADVAEAGGRRVVVVRAITEASDPARAAKALVEGLG